MVLRYAKLISDNHYAVALGDNEEYFKKIGYTLLDVTKSDKDNQWYLTSECPMKTEEEKEAENQEVINHLVCTALDLATFIKQTGLIDAEIVQFLNANPSLQLQLTLCKDVYCGVVRQLCPLKISDTVTLTDEVVVSFFKKKYNIT